MNIEAGTVANSGWHNRLGSVGDVVMRCLGAYAAAVVTSRFQPEIYGNQDPIDLEVAEFAAALPKYYKSSDWE